ncbi:hypothetical protein RchiOBHm_Chr3g0448391 [Rosa chinensis]|uniref:Late embryogenesis abundant protein, LEA-14 n=1 Tax=Rosa chinensis TaxID=74649 RepID=A0A2P6R584_ROSCH|nr:NDR1/HIN1-like protein 3 [Rosa chinensis]PRQ41583.1 hypothetical protein RchiOBHm_Chr3g0448391 [Rosa chinensis]
MARTSGCQRRSTTAAQDSDRETEHCRCWIILLVVFLFLLLVFYFVESIIRSGPPDDIKITVTDASLTEFNITSSNNYNLDLNITLRNPNKDFGIYYRYKALVVADYRKTSAMASIANFHQPAKNTTLLTPSFKLQRDNITGDAAASGKGNYYDIVVTLYLPKKYVQVRHLVEERLAKQYTTLRM